MRKLIVIVISLLCLAVRLAPASGQEDELGILFYSERDAAPGLYWMREDGTGIEQVFDNRFLNLTRGDDVQRTEASTGLSFLSPDGRMIVVASPTTDLSGPYLGFDLWVMNVDGTDPQRLTNTFDIIELEPRWSPDSQHIVYCALDNHANQSINVVDLQTGNTKAIVTDESLPLSITPYCADWSPDGMHIVFTSTYFVSGKPAFRVHTINEDGSSLTEVVALEPSEWLLGWHEFDGKLYFLCGSSQTNICRVDLDTREVETVLAVESTQEVIRGVQNIDLSATGHIVLGILEPQGRPAENPPIYEEVTSIYVVNSLGADLVILLSDENHNYVLGWSPRPANLPPA
jgi:Tol biopolymer transport system component